jgi:hypothetical protein
MMNRTIARAALIATALTALAGLSACNRGGGNEGGLTAEDNRQLDNAADMLDTSPDSLVADNGADLGNGDVDDDEGNDTGTVAANAQ